MARIKNIEVTNLKNISENYGWLMKIHGIQIDKNKRNIFPKILSYVWLIMMHSHVINLICMYNLLMALSPPLFFEVSAACVFSIMVWYLLKCKEMQLKNLIFKMNSTEIRHAFTPFIGKKNNFLLVIIFCFSICIIVLNVYRIEYGQDIQKRFFTFNTVFHSYFAKVVIRVYAFSIYFLTMYTFPLLSSLLCCLMYYHLSKIILQWRKKFEIQVREHGMILNHEFIIQAFNELTGLIKLSKKLDEIVSPITFLLLSLQIVLLLCYIVSIVTVRISNMDFQLKLEVFLGIPISLSGIVSIIIFASLIEKRYSDIKKKIKYVHDMNINYRLKDNHISEIIRYMIFMKFPVMTVLSDIKLRPSLIFSSVGISLTFGLLSIQIFDQSDN